MSKYDCIVIGGGFGGMAFALLYAMSGKKTALFEYHDKLGGYGHSFERNGYTFCANMHYFFDTKPNGTVDEFLNRTGLNGNVNFRNLNKDGFDVIRINDYLFRIPSSLEKYRDQLINEFPENKKSINKIFKIRHDLATIAKMYSDQGKYFLLSILKHPIQLLNFMRYSFKSSQSVLDDLNIHGDLRAILLSRLGNFGLLSSDVPLLMLLLEMTYYTDCATFPEQGMGHFITLIHKKCVEHNVSLFLNTEIKKINYDGKKIISVMDQHDIEYFADLYVSDIDPQLTFKLCQYPIPKKYHYHYTYSCFSLYLGLKDINLEHYSFGKHNIWYFPTNQLDANCQAVLSQLDYTQSFLFISTPSMHARPNALSQAGSHTMQIVVPADYELIAALYHNNKNQYEQLKEQVKQCILNVLARKFIPSIRDHIEIEELWSPIDLMNKIKTPCAAMYGMRPDLRKILWPIGQQSPFSNLYFVGASASHAGLAPVLNGAMILFDKLKHEALSRHSDPLKQT